MTMLDNSIQLNSTGGHRQDKVRETQQKEAGIHTGEKELGLGILTVWPFTRLDFPK